MCEFLVYCTVKKLESLVALLTFYLADVKPQSFAFITTALYILIIIVFFDIFFNQKFKQICISLHFVSLKSPIIHPYTEQSPQAHPAERFAPQGIRRIFCESKRTGTPKCRFPQFP